MKPRSDEGEPKQPPLSAGSRHRPFWKLTDDPLLPLDVTFRPIDIWPGQQTNARRYSQFKATEGATWALLKRELAQIDASHIVIQIALRDDQIRLDGWPRSGVTPTHPGVIVAFDSRYGPLKYATDTFIRYPENLRAIALGLESLRRVDRYGITKRGEQYTGWKALTAGPASDPDLVARGRALIAEHGGEIEAIKATHPDAGGNDADFAAVQAAREAGRSA